MNPRNAPAEVYGLGFLYSTRCSRIGCSSDPDSPTRRVGLFLFDGERFQRVELPIRRCERHQTTEVDEFISGPAEYRWQRMSADFQAVGGKAPQKRWTTLVYLAEDEALADVPAPYHIRKR